MNRLYNNHTHADAVSFFIGTEVEKTPAAGMKTLFVVGVQSVDSIEACLMHENFNLNGTERIKHIYFGANMSFPKLDINDHTHWQQWERMVKHFLNLDYLCTLDIDCTCAEGLAESGLTEYNNFIPMISVKLPYLQLLGYNAVLKLDDKDFKASNPGVWCHSLHDLTNRNYFTSWDKYTQDKVIK